MGVLFARNGDPSRVDLTRFYAFFEGSELARTGALIASIVDRRTFGHFAVEDVDRSAIRGDTFKCRVFMRFVMVGTPGGTGRPMACGPRVGLMYW